MQRFPLTYPVRTRSASVDAGQLLACECRADLICDNGDSRRLPTPRRAMITGTSPTSRSEKDSQQDTGERHDRDGFDEAAMQPQNEERGDER
jgi:hypothetical protein